MRRDGGRWQMHVEAYYVARAGGSALRRQLVERLTQVRRVLAEEREETRAMLESYRRYTQGRASDEEMRRANEQFRELLRAAGVGALAVLPFAPLTLPAAVRLGRRLGIEVLPGWLRRPGSHA